jgi:predicted Zn finger-like uncharacterized protein
MRFSCEGCNAKYMISDDKVGPSGVKVRCKKCGHVTLVRKGAPEAAGPGPTSPGVEWWVAIDDRPVGPVGLEAVQRHWDQGEIGPESLVWYSGLAEWTPLGSVPELHAHLMGGYPPPAAQPPSPVPAAAEPEPVAEPAPTPAPSEEWRPSAASALAALETPAGAYAEPAAAEPPAAPPEEPSGPIGADPSGIRPLPMAGLERAGERRDGTTPGSRGPAALGSTTPPPREGNALRVVLAVAIVVVVAAVAALWWFTR